MTRLRLLLVVVGLALFLGAGSRVLLRAGLELPHGDALLAAGGVAKALGAPWLAVAWGIGAIAGSRPRGAAAGAAALALGTFAWYLLTVAVAGRGAALEVLPIATGWAVAASLAGAVFGLAGAAWRDGGSTVRAVSAAALAGALAGEAVLLAGEWSGRAASAVLLAELAMAFMVLAAVRRRVPVGLTLALFAVTALALAGLEDTVRDTLRLAGWRGP
jgi:Family of unknown function (DUF6518)